MINNDSAIENAKGWLASIEDMLDAPYKAAAESEGWSGPHTDTGQNYYRDVSDGQTWACDSWRELCEEFKIAPPDSDMDQARQTIEESVLSVQVRSGWYSPGATDGAKPEEYELLLTTGGPALRIIGRLSEHGEPESAEMQWRDWGSPWTRFPAPEATLLAFANHFYFGE